MMDSQGTVSRSTASHWAPICAQFLTLAATALIPLGPGSAAEFPSEAGAAVLTEAASDPLAANSLLLDDGLLTNEAGSVDTWIAPVADQQSEKKQDLIAAPEPASAALAVSIVCLVLLMTLLRLRFDSMSTSAVPVRSGKRPQ